MDVTPANIQPWIDLLGKPTIGVVIFIILILYREAVIHFINSLVDIAASWAKRN